MSIIHEALKKTQKSLEKNDPNVDRKTSLPKLPQNKTAPITDDIKIVSDIEEKTLDKIKKKKKSNLNALIIIYGIFVLLAISLLSKNNIDKLMAATKLEHKTQTPTPQQVKPLPKKSIPSAKINSSNIHFNGTMKMDGKIVALINEDVYETGEMIESFSILSITLKELTLQHQNGEITKLRVKSK